MRQFTVSSLIQAIACRLCGAKPLQEPMLIYCQLDSWEQFSMKFGGHFVKSDRVMMSTFGER